MHRSGNGSDVVCTIDTVLVKFRRVLAASKRSMSVSASEAATWTKERKKKWWVVRRHVRLVLLLRSPTFVVEGIAIGCDAIGS